jgi:hypothetical protein
MIDHHFKYPSSAAIGVVRNLAYRFLAGSTAMMQAARELALAGVFVPATAPDSFHPSQQDPLATADAGSRPVVLWCVCHFLSFVFLL